MDFVFAIFAPYFVLRFVRQDTRTRTNKEDEATRLPTQVPTIVGMSGAGRSRDAKNVAGTPASGPLQTCQTATKIGQLYMESTAAEALGFGTNGNLFDPQIERNRAPVRTDHDTIISFLELSAEGALAAIDQQRRFNARR